jgi:hypothetical protein
MVLSLISHMCLLTIPHHLQCPASLLLFLRVLLDSVDSSRKDVETKMLASYKEALSRGELC